MRRVKRALVRGADIDGKGSGLDYPPLVLAAGCGLVKMVKLLLREGANVDVAVPRDVLCCSDGGCIKYRWFFETTALHVAAYSGELDVVRLLLR